MHKQRNPKLLYIRAVDPDSLNPLPDPAFQVNPDPIHIQGFDDQKPKKRNTAEYFCMKRSEL
jgi:hypothetical protein